MSDNASAEPDDTVGSIDPEQLYEQVDGDEEVTILDVRATDEYEQWHISGDDVTVANVPYFDFLDGVTDELLEQVPDGEPVVVVCAKGGSSEMVAELLVEAGVDAVNLAGGMNEWARVYRATELSFDTDATVLQYLRPSSGCLSYMVVSDGEAAVVDPLREFTERYVADAESRGADIRYTMDTHIHADHVSGARKLAEETDATLAYPKPALDRGTGFTPSRVLEDGDELAVGSATVTVKHAPGHTSGMTSYALDDSALFTGDFLFVESVARPDLESGDEGAPEAAGQLYDSLQELRELPTDIVVAPGHVSDSATPAADGTYTDTLGHLFDRMGALSMDRDEFVEFVLSDMPERPSNYEDIIDTNRGVRETDDEEAFELELGPNNCAASQEDLTQG
ncbi:MBL fold metallo-hydrolase [Haloarchaeobius sp. TZWWS8]|uniref:MBL fold metallo-hydrolase n=1 Tax=Haloarchaeobius sp. TZWWS8 TaxID=3446121 RepID=UPI003EC03860